MILRWNQPTWYRNPTDQLWMIQQDPGNTHPHQKEDEKKPEIFVNPPRYFKRPLDYFRSCCRHVLLTYWPRNGQHSVVVICRFQVFRPWQFPNQLCRIVNEKREMLWANPMFGTLITQADQRHLVLISIAEQAMRIYLICHIGTFLRGDTKHNESN